MQGRSIAVLLVIAAAIAGLGLYRSTEHAAEQRSADEPPAAAPDRSAARPALLDFGRGTCIPCQKMMPVLDELARRHANDVDVTYCDLAEPANQERAKELAVRVIPTQVLLGADGSEVGRHEGFWPLEEIEARFEELGWTPAR